MIKDVLIKYGVAIVNDNFVFYEERKKLKANFADEQGEEIFIYSDANVKEFYDGGKYIGVSGDTLQHFSGFSCPISIDNFEKSLQEILSKYKSTNNQLSLF